MVNQYTKAKLLRKARRKEIAWNLINAGLVGAISFFSAVMATGKLNLQNTLIALFAAIVVALIRFQDYWLKEKNEYCNKIFKIF